MNAKVIAVMATLAIAHMVHTAAASNQTGYIQASREADSAAEITLSKAQAQAAGMTDVVRNFDIIDANKDGVVTRSELRVYALSMRRHAPMT